MKKILLLLMLFTAVTGCSQKEPPPPPPEITVPVQTLIVEPQTLTDFRELTGTTMACEEVTVSAQVGGRIDGLFFEIGDKLHRGATLIKIDDDLFISAVEQAEANRNGAKASLVAAVNNYHRIDQLHTQQIVSDEVMDNAMQQRDAATAAHQAADATLSTAKRNLRETTVVSPLTGTVVRKYVESGENVNPGQQIAMINDLSALEIGIGIPEEDINLVHPGDEVLIALPGTSNEPITGVITSISLKAELATRTFPAEITVSNPEGLGIYPGMVVTVSLTRHVFTDTLFLPHHAVLSNAEGNYVFIPDGVIAKPIPVTTGASLQNLIEITTGLDSGTEIIISGLENLQVGDTVSVRN